ncbi:MAG: hypothetical protein P4M11_07850 [Candidatus Pacebacteria bacterium]|nr:hypothetical protein [Candidatus Paceibacterota bacterium]
MEEYTPLLQSLSEILDLTIPAALVAPSKECFEHLQKLALAAEASKRTALVGELYVWLQDHVAKMIKDGIFKEIRTVGKVHMRTDRLGLMRSWCELQRTVLKGKKQYLAEQKGTKCTCKYSGYGPEVLLPEFAHLIGKFRRLLE